MTPAEPTVAGLCLLTELPEDCQPDYLDALIQHRELVDHWVICNLPTHLRQHLEGIPDASILMFSESLNDAWSQFQSQVSEQDWVLLLPVGMQLQRCLGQSAIPAAHNNDAQVLSIDCLDGISMTRRLPLMIRAASITHQPPQEDGWRTETGRLAYHRGFRLRCQPAFASTQAARQLALGEVTCALRVAQAAEMTGDVRNALSVYDMAFEETQASSQDRWLAGYRGAVLREQLQAPATDIVALCQRLVDLWPERIEPLILMARQLRLAGEVAQAEALLSLCDDVPVTEPNLPHCAEDYRTGVLREQIHCAAASSRDAEVVSLATEFYRRSMGQHADNICRLRDQAWANLNPALPINREARIYFVIIVAFRNAQAWLQGCVDSIVAQRWQHYRVILIDDNSDDDAMDKLDLRGSQRFELVRHNERRGALANQVQALKSLIEPDDIVLFVDGDDQLAHPDVLPNLAGFYRDTGCWLSYGSARHGSARQADTRRLNAGAKEPDAELWGRRGYARPVLPDESIASLFQGNLLIFPIHLRSHRVGLFHRLLEQDPELMCLRGADGNYIAHASDVAHMRAMMMLSGHRHSRYNPEILYHYNDQNPESHFRQAADQLAADVAHIAALPEIEPCHSYLPGAGIAEGQPRGAAKLLVIAVEGCEPDLIERYRRAGDMPNLQRSLENSVALDIEEGFANDIFWRGLLTGKKVGDYANFFRLALAPDGYRDLNVFDNDAWATVDGFWNELALAGHQVGVFNASDLRITQQIANVTQVSNWLLHASTGRPHSDPPELIEQLHRQNPRPDLQRTYDSNEMVSAEACEPMLVNICAAEQIKVAAYAQLLARGDWDLFFCGLDATHDVMHELWHFHDPASPHYDGSVDDPIPAVYRQLDQSLGLLLETVGPAPVAVVCGLGSQAQRSLNSALPTILDALEADYRQCEPESARWERWFYTLRAAPLSGLIRFNLQGRDRLGLIPQDEYDKWCDCLIKDLKALRYIESGAPVVKEVVRLPERHAGLYSDRLADLLVIWSENQMNEALSSDKVPPLEFKPDPADVLDFRSGDHNNHAAVYFNAEFARAADLQSDQSVRYTDVAEIFAMVTRGA